MANVKITLSIPETTNLSAEKISKTLHISKSEVFDKALKLFEKEQRLEKIRKAVSNPDVIAYYKTNEDVNAWQELDRGYRESV